MRRVVLTDSRGRAWLVLRARGGGFTRWPVRARFADRGGHLDEAGEVAALAWAKARGEARSVPSGEFPFVRVPSGVKRPDQSLMMALDGVGRRVRRVVEIRSGWRSPYDQWRLRQRYLAGRGNLAALCCAKAWAHSWEECGREPRSNHCYGRAADCGVLAPTYVSMGAAGGKVRRAMRQEGLCLPVPGEAWHVEVGASWRA